MKTLALFFSITNFLLALQLVISADTSVINSDFFWFLALCLLSAYTFVKYKE